MKYFKTFNFYKVFYISIYHNHCDKFWHLKCRKYFHPYLDHFYFDFSLEKYMYVMLSNKICYNHATAYL